MHCAVAFWRPALHAGSFGVALGNPRAFGTLGKHADKGRLSRLVTPWTSMEREVKLRSPLKLHISARSAERKFWFLNRTMMFFFFFPEILELHSGIWNRTLFFFVFLWNLESAFEVFFLKPEGAASPAIGP